MTEPSHYSNDAQIEQQAADWLARLDDGLSGNEQDQFLEWLTKDPKHREAMELYQWGWGEFDRLAGVQLTQSAEIEPDLLSHRGKKNRKIFNFIGKQSLGAAALIMICIGVPLGLWVTNHSENTDAVPAYQLMERLERQELPDGSMVDLNRGAKISVHFSKQERVVFLNGGEANFSVAKDTERPFLVSVGGVNVRAVGTVFNIRYVGNNVDVVVSEGAVEVGLDTQPHQNSQQPDSSKLLKVGQKVRVSLNEGRPEMNIIDLTPEAMAEELLWQPRLLKFDSVPLTDIVETFNRHNQIQVVVDDPALESIVLSSAFWSDNVEGFLRLMENNFNMQIEWIDSLTIRLSKSS